MALTILGSRDGGALAQGKRAPFAKIRPAGRARWDGNEGKRVRTRASECEGAAPHFLPTRERKKNDAEAIVATSAEVPHAQRGFLADIRFGLPVFFSSLHVVFVCSA